MSDPKTHLKEKNAVKEAGATGYIAMASRDSDSDIAF
jgi:hypothetical protein